MNTRNASPRRFVITGCGRSATMYIADLLSELGCETGHEDFFPKGITAASVRLSRLGLKPISWKRPPWGEAAWEAAPFLHLMPKDTVVFHQLRHPLGFVRSRQRKGLSRAGFRDRHAPVCSGVTNKYQFWELPLSRQVEYLTEFWIDWNALVEANAKGMEYYRYRLEDMTADHLEWMLQKIGFPAPRARLEEVYTRTSRTVNQGKAPSDEVSFDLLPTQLRDRLRDVCNRYGFEL